MLTNQNGGVWRGRRDLKDTGAHSCCAVVSRSGELLHKKADMFLCYINTPHDKNIKKCWLMIKYQQLSLTSRQADRLLAVATDVSE